MKLLSTTIFVFLSISLIAQQESVVNQFWNNQTHLNPAFAGLEYQLQAGVLYRNQWDGVNGAPNDLQGFYNMRLGQDWGSGININGGTIGFDQTFNISVPASYRIKLNHKNTLAFGTALALRHRSIDAALFPPTSEPDPILIQTSGQTLAAHTGVAFINNWITGSFSVQNIRLVNLSKNSNFRYSPLLVSMIRLKAPIGGKSSYNNNSQIMLEALHSYQNGFQRLQVNGRLLLRDKLSLFAGHVFNYSFVFGGGWDFYKKFRATYSAAIYRSPLQSAVTSVTHEVSFVFQLPVKE